MKTNPQNSVYNRQDRLKVLFRFLGMVIKQIFTVVKRKKEEKSGKGQPE